MPRAAAAILIGLHLVLGVWAARTHSATFDEPVHIAAGYSAWKTGDRRLCGEHPPLAQLLIGAPLLFQKVFLPLETREWRERLAGPFAERFLYWSGNDAERIVLSARLANLLLSCLLGLILWHFARSRWGDGPALLALSFYCFSPAVLAHASLATVDFSAAFFAALGALAMMTFLREPGPRQGLAVALVSAAAFLCKHTALLLWPAYALILIGELARERSKALPLLRSFAVFAFLPCLGILALYLWTGQDAWQIFMNQLHAVGQGHPSFLLGRYSARGWLAYYAAAFLTKSTLSEILLLAGLGWLLASKERRLAREAGVPAAVICAYFAAASLSHKQIGLRYILPVYPLLALSAAPIAQRLAGRWRHGLRVAVAAGACHALSTGLVAPNFLSYFNEAAGGPSNGYKILVDSNLDWGQDMKRLAAYLKREGNPEVILSYFGTASPEYYGVRAQRLACGNTIQLRWRNSDRPGKELLVVSATNLQGPYYPPGQRLSWLKDVRPVARVGYGLFVYDVTEDAAIHRRLAEIYSSRGDAPLAAHEMRRAEIIAAGRPRA
jgi:hypothetical protein